MNQQFQKRAPDALVVAVEMSTYPLKPGATLVATNARGSLAVTVLDSAGTDVSGALLEGAPWIVDGTQVAFWLLAGVPGPNYTGQVLTPTSDGELLSERFLLKVLP